MCSDMICDVICDLIYLDGTFNWVSFFESVL